MVCNKETVSHMSYLTRHQLCSNMHYVSEFLKHYITNNITHFFVTLHHQGCDPGQTGLQWRNHAKAPSTSSQILWAACVDVWWWHTFWSQSLRCRSVACPATVDLQIHGSCRSLSKLSTFIVKKKKRQKFIPGMHIYQNKPLKQMLLV